MGNTGLSYITDQVRSRRWSWECRLLLDKMLCRGLTKRKLSVLVSCLFRLLFFSLLSLPMAPTPTATYGDKRQGWPRERLSHLCHRTASLREQEAAETFLTPGNWGEGWTPTLPYPQVLTVGSSFAKQDVSQPLAPSR